MENKNVGYIIIGISALIVFIIFLFNNALTKIVQVSCGMEHALTCPMSQAIDQQTYLALGIVGILGIVGLTLILSKPNEKIVIQTKTITKKVPKRKRDTHELTKEEKDILAIIQSHKAIFQASLIEQTGIGKVKMTRILDRLEGKDFIERKRRGMTNVVVIKEN